jgi:integrase
LKLRERTYASGLIGWQLDYGVVNGRRKQVAFSRLKEAQKALKDAQTARQRHGEMGVALTTAELADAMLASGKLAEHGVSLIEAVDFYLAHAKAVKRKVLIGELVTLFIAARWEDDASVRYRRQLKVSLSSLARSHAMRHAHEITREHVERWLRGHGWAAKTRNNYLGDARALFAWAVKEGYAARNPCDGIEKARLTEEEIGTLTVEQCAALLKAAVAYRNQRNGQQELLGYVVLGMFCGVRPAELGRMDWAAVDVPNGTVIVAGSHAKTRRRRVVDLPDCAKAWLRLLPLAQRSGDRRICSKAHSTKWERFRQAAGYLVNAKTGKGVPWPHNALRHTFASMHYAARQNEALLQAQMGHENAAMLHRHYRALKTRAEAERFWKLKP